jgi:hypothetical protein
MGSGISASRLHSQTGILRNKSIPVSSEMPKVESNATVVKKKDAIASTDQVLLQ